MALPTELHPTCWEAQLFQFIHCSPLFVVRAPPKVARSLRFCQVTVVMPPSEAMDLRAELMHGRGTVEPRASGRRLLSSDRLTG